MKRSEMVEAIVKFMVDNNEDPCLTPQEAAELFLTQVEKEGMLPPPTLKTTLGQWEPEDD